MIRFLILLFVAGVSSQQPEVTTTLGVLKGLTLKSENGRPFFGFKGIPYAKPPIGKHRFKQSVPGGKWLGVLNATRTPNMCLQRVGLGMLKEHYPLEIMGSEDCLYLNIFTPKLPADLPDGKLLDVVFNIHGGAFQILSGDVVGPEYIMDRDVVYVSINYRLGLLGFLSLEDKSCPGNNGLKDQNLALKWVNKHIAAFGGDPNKITIVGCSAGGASVHYHLLSPLSRGLFRKAISNSGAIHNPWALTKKPKEKAMVIAEAVGCPTNDTVLLLECLRDRPAEELVGSIKLFEVWKHLPVSPMGPVIEVPSATAFIDQQPDDLIKSKNINDVPVLFSHNSDEGSMFTVMTIENPEEVAEVDERWDFLTPIMYEMADTTNPYNGKELPQLIRSHYMGTKKLSEALPQLIQSIGDRFFVAGIQRAALLHAEHQSSPVYMYKFSYPGKEFNAFNKIVEKYNPDPGAPHCLDSCFVYKLTVISMGLENSTEAMVMSKTMIDYHMKFITETPVPEWSTVKSGLPNLKLLDIVSTDPSKNEFKIEEPVALKFWDSLNLLENSEENVNPTAVHSEL